MMEGGSAVAPRTCASIRRPCSRCSGRFAKGPFGRAFVISWEADHNTGTFFDRLIMMEDNIEVRRFETAGVPS